MIKVSLLGVGHLGEIHCRLLKQHSDKIDFIGIFDIDISLSKKIATEYKIKYFNTAKEAINAADACFIVVPTSLHYEYASICIKKQKHCFIEKPVAATLKEAQNLIKIKTNNTKIQIGHVERFNPAIIAIKNKIDTPLFMEAHRLSQFRPRSNDVSIIHDLMIHDIDLLLFLINNDNIKVKEIDANGLAIITNNIDIANARIKFNNGTVANITASRISAKNMRKVRLFNKTSYLSIDLQNPTAECFKLNDNNNNNTTSTTLLGEINNKQIVFEKFDIPNINAILEEQNAFFDSIINDKQTDVTLEEGTKALEIAVEIEKIITTTNKHFAAIK